MAGDGGVRAEHINHYGIKPAFCGGDEATCIIDDEFATYGFAQEVFFGDFLDRRININVGVAV
jgi:hypothetical protein